ncbi:MAG: hypothetical protein OIF57_06590 [Marinobacterium sp.]|nr:hypothetical protein [Marinobacterium sp.]
MSDKTISSLSIHRQIYELEVLEAALTCRCHKVPQQKKDNPIKPTRLLPDIDRRLVQWGEWQLRERLDNSSEASGSSLLGVIIDSVGEVIRSTGFDYNTMPDAVYDTDRAIRNLPESLQRVLEIQYTRLHLTAVQKAEIYGCSSKTFYRRLIEAQHSLYALL